MTGTLRTIQAGDHVRHASGGTGLVSLGVRSLDDDKMRILSCAHVLAPRDHLVKGPPAVDVIESPQTVSPTTPDRIGTLKEFTTFQLINRVDAATCLPDAGIEVPLGLVAGRPVSRVWDPRTPGTTIVGRQVWRLDQDGQRIEGEIIGPATPTVNFLDGFDPVQFDSILCYRASHRSGDSGGPVLDTLTDDLVGLHFAGEDVEQSYLCLAILVFATLRLSLS